MLCEHSVKRVYDIGEIQLGCIELFLSSNVVNGIDARGYIAVMEVSNVLYLNKVCLLAT